MSLWFSTSYYFSAKLAQLRAVGERDASGHEYTLQTLQDAFTRAGLTPESHFERYGRAEGLNPNPYFNEVEYLQAKTAQVNSIRQEGKSPCEASSSRAATEAHS